jgi:hypothetical protein
MTTGRSTWRYKGPRREQAEKRERNDLRFERVGRVDAQPGRGEAVTGAGREIRGLAVKPGVTERAPLTQEIPTLVERDLELAQALAIGVVGRPS